MLKIIKLSKAFWGEAAQTAYYLINRSPSSPLNFEVLEKAWTRKEVFYSHLRVSLNVKLLCMFPKNRYPNLMIRQFHMSLLGMVMKSLDSNCRIQPRRNW